MPRKRNGCAIALFVGLIAFAGGVHAQAPPAERSLTLPSGATLKVATDIVHSTIRKRVGDVTLVRTGIAENLVAKPAYAA